MYIIQLLIGNSLTFNNNSKHSFIKMHCSLILGNNKLCALLEN